MGREIQTFGTRRHWRENRRFPVPKICSIIKHDDFAELVLAMLGVAAHQMREAVRRRDVDKETLRSIGRSYNVTISRLAAQMALDGP